MQLSTKERRQPEYGKQYRLMGGKNEPSIRNGNTWAESEVKKESHFIDVTPAGYGPA
ncbi:MAG: hypothetical protein NTZ97_01210 [Candidatus Moranbacteria bacterium]|nr:hypothetical protein [Candidatus Moranbacteria bacterium]